MDFGRLAHQFDRLRALAPGDRARELDALAATEPALTTELQRLFAVHSDDADEFAAPGQVFSPGLIADAVTEAGSPVPAPHRIGAFRPIRELGRGGMGTVWLARREDSDFEQLVAIKVLRAQHDDRDLVRRFRTERRILAALKHPNIAALLDGGTTDQGQPFVVMEYVDGEDLIAHCRRNGLDVRARLVLFVKVCRAVAHAHRALVVHRDLKPGNILVGKDGEPKLLDFGIAKLLQDDAESTPTIAVTRTGNMLLTPEYSSPEQVRGEPITTATDVYALGAILYEVLCGRRAQPLANRSIETLLEFVCERTPPPPSSVLRADPATAGDARRVRGDLDTIVAFAMRKEPERRYESAAALADDIDRHLAGLPVTARGDTFAYRTRSFVRRNRLAVAGAALLFGVLVAFAATTAVQNSTISAERDAAITARTVAEQTSEFLVELFQMATPDPERAETLRARDLLDRGARRVEDVLSESPIGRAMLQVSMGRAYLALGLYDEAQPLLTAARRTTAEQATDRRVHRTAQFWSGLNAMHLGRDAAGEPLLRASLEPCTEGPSSGPAERVFRLSILASWLRDLGRYDEALQQLDQAEAIVRSGELPPGELRAILELRIGRAAILREEGRFEDSLAILRDLLAEAEAGGGAEHPRYIDLHRELGRTHKELDDLDAARAAFERTLRLSRTFIGENHPDVDTALFELGMLEFELGDFERAETVLREMLARDLARFGPEHVYPAMVRGQLAMVIGSMDRPEEAEELFLETLAVQRRVLPEIHPELATTLANLGTFYHRNRRYDEAQPLMREALEIRQQIHGPDHPAVLTARNQIAVVELDRGNAAAAEAEFRQVLEARRRRLGTHAETAGSLLSLATAIARQGRQEEALPLFEESQAMFDSTLPAGHPTRARPRLGRAVALMKLERPAEAEPLVREAVRLYADALGSDHVDVGYAELLLARCVAEQRRTDEAIALLRPLHERLRASHAGHPVQLQTRDVLATLLEGTGDAAGAAAVRR